MRRIGILTSGGDAPGMNAGIRAVVRFAIYKGMEVVGIERGYIGMVEGEMYELNKRSVSDIIHRGGTILKTARCPEFNTLEGQAKAVANLKKRNIDGVIVLGGDGSFRGCKDLVENFGVPTIGIPCTIDNDLPYTDFTIGFDTAVNTVLSAINNLRDTMTSHERISIVEVMGRRCGDIALYAGVGGGAEIILTPEMGIDLDEVVQKLEEGAVSGKTSGIIVFAEGAGNSQELKKKIQEKLNVSIRITTLGHIQRGGTPSMSDRMLAARLAERAVDLISSGIGNRVVGIKNNQIIDEEIAAALSQKRIFDKQLFEAAKILSL